MVKLTKCVCHIFQSCTLWYLSIQYWMSSTSARTGANWYLVCISSGLCGWIRFGSRQCTVAHAERIVPAFNPRKGKWYCYRCKLGLQSGHLHFFLEYDQWRIGCWNLLVLRRSVHRILDIFHLWSSWGKKKKFKPNIIVTRECKVLIWLNSFLLDCKQISGGNSSSISVMNDSPNLTARLSVYLPISKIILSYATRRSIQLHIIS